MEVMEVMEIIEKAKIIPVIAIDDAKDAKPLAKALLDGGLPIAEVTFRTDAAEESIRIISKEYPEILVGAGSLTSSGQAKVAVEAGAKFLVTAGFNRGVVEYAVENHIPVVPGVCTPSELMWLMEYGLSLAKFFPAEQCGGPEMIKAIAAPFPKMKFLPTGGINAQNIKDYLALPMVVACGGSWMVKKSLINEGKFDEITSLTKEVMEYIHSED